MAARAIVLCFEGVNPTDIADQFVLFFRAVMMDSVDGYSEVRSMGVAFLASDSANVLGTKIAAEVRRESLTTGRTIEPNQVLIPTFAKG